jgi:hypothetical protein
MISASMIHIMVRQLETKSQNIELYFNFSNKLLLLF